MYTHNIIFLIQLQKELAAVVKSDLTKDEEVRSTWTEFLEKINRKVEIEASKSNLQKLSVYASIHDRGFTRATSTLMRLAGQM